MEYRLFHNSTIFLPTYISIFRIADTHNQTHMYNLYAFNSFEKILNIQFLTGLLLNVLLKSGLFEIAIFLRDGVCSVHFRSKNLKMKLRKSLRTKATNNIGMMVMISSLIPQINQNL